MRNKEDRTQSATALHKKNINDLHVEVGHPSQSITHATAKVMGIQVTSTFKPCEDFTLGKVNENGVSKKAVACSKFLGKRLFFDINSPSTLTFEGKKYWQLVKEESSNYAWSFFIKDKSNLAGVILG